MTTEIQIADVNNPQHAAALLYLLNEYAQDAMGGGAELPEHVKQGLIPALQQRAFVTAILAFVDQQPAGLAICIEGFSTFACQAVLNIHDFVVVQHYRGQGLSQQLLTAVEQLARARQCCKITLEVLEGNHIAKQAYLKFGFEGYQLDPTMGNAMFWQKKLS